MQGSLCPVGGVQVGLREMTKKPETSEIALSAIDERERGNWEGGFTEKDIRETMMNGFDTTGRSKDPLFYFLQVYSANLKLYLITLYCIPMVFLLKKPSSSIAGSAAIKNPHRACNVYAFPNSTTHTSGFLFPPLFWSSDFKRIPCDPLLSLSPLSSLLSLTLSRSGGWNKGGQQWKKRLRPTN